MKIIVFISILLLLHVTAYSLEYGCSSYKEEVQRLQLSNNNLRNELLTLKKESESYEQKLKTMLNSPNLWNKLKGKWEINGGMIKYLGADDVQDNFGILINNFQHLWQGSIEATVIFQGEGGAHIVFSYQPVERYYLTAGIGRIFQDENAFIMTEQNGKTYKKIAYFGTKKDNINENTEYKIILNIEGNELSLTVNGIKVISKKMDNIIYSDRIGLFAFGANPVEFKNFKITSIEP